MRLYLRALSYFRHDWRLICCWVLMIGMSTAIGLLSAWPMAVLVDSVLSTTPAAQRQFHHLLLHLLPKNPTGQIVGLAVTGLLLKLTQDLLSAIQTVVSNHINYNGLVRVRCDLYRKLQALSMAYHKSQPQGDAIYRLSSDTFGCQSILGVVVATFVAVITLVVMTYILSSRSVALTVLAFSIVPPLAFANVVFGRRLKQRSIECRQRDSDFTTVVQRSMSYIGLVQAFGREASEFGQFRESVHQTVGAWWRLNRQQITYNILVGTLFGFGGAAIFGYGGYLVFHGVLSLGDLMVFTCYLGMMWGPLCTLTGFSANMQGGVAGAQRVFEVLDRDSIIKDMPGALVLPCRPRVLELDGVSFGYGDGGLIIDDVSVRITPGQMVAFVGSSGVGKSTLLNLLPRFYDPTAGNVSLDGIDVRTIQLKDLRRHMALVLQENVILPATMAENIAYGRPDATHAQIRAAAHLAGADVFIESLPEGYDSRASEGGQNLSGGQRQRIAIARALLTEAPILILDEPTSALDPIHEQLITETLGRLKGKRTIVLVSHRLSTVRNCDQIFVMDSGQVVESGTHEELMKAGVVYQRMALHQLGPRNFIPTLPKAA